LPRKLLIPKTTSARAGEMTISRTSNCRRPGLSSKDLLGGVITNSPREDQDKHRTSPAIDARGSSRTSRLHIPWCPTASLTRSETRDGRKSSQITQRLRVIAENHSRPDPNVNSITSGFGFAAVRAECPMMTHCTSELQELTLRWITTRNDLECDSAAASKKPPITEDTKSPATLQIREKNLDFHGLCPPTNHSPSMAGFTANVNCSIPSTAARYAH